jgi:hypothetical protein
VLHLLYELGRFNSIAAFGNSDGDLQMLQWTAAGEGKPFMLLVHHTDAQREYAYDRESHIGKLNKALDAAQQDGWTVVDMQNDWIAAFVNHHPNYQRLLLGGDLYVD